MSSRKLDEEEQKAFIEDYDKFLNSLGNDEVVLFADAVHPTHAARPVGCWAPKQDKLAIEQTSGRERINIHGAKVMDLTRFCLGQLVARSQRRVAAELVFHDLFPSNLRK